MLATLPVYTLAALSALAIVAGSVAGQDASAVEAFLRRCEAARPSVAAARSASSSQPSTGHASETIRPATAAAAPAPETIR